MCEISGLYPNMKNQREEFGGMTPAALGWDACLEITGALSATYSVCDISQTLG